MIGERIELRLGDAEAVIGTVAAVLAGLRIGGIHLTEPIAEGEPPALCSGMVLAPWPNRVRAGRWELDGAVQQLDISEPARGGALHGLLRHEEYAILERGESHVVLGALIPPQHGWPFSLATTVRYELRPDGLRVEHGVRNVGRGRAPWAVGTHPYLRIGDIPVEELRLTVHADEHYLVDEVLDPTGTAPVDGAPEDLRHGPRIGDLVLDTAYRGVAHVDGASARLDAPDGASLELLQDADWRYVQVFTAVPGMPGRDFPKADAGGRVGWAVAVEPMTAPPDALNSGEGLVWLEEGEAWSGSWGLRFTPAR
ncbi:aldose 1-epimerase family protein [Homoserinibacter sp. YIM 151385]|uniref:aldose 1-epimerase family protein n=1 Tax=Homoserinibacter sp. YIM 151385 TaxID=2985506 RepID=UPI0022F0441C|nr:aldose 1-epimerase family protein [Homoserinibacter sp. YIM 151385]WBU36736.1 aldose 1-epimerase family protein [Homoserinibacter sp. YIM 151385]